MGQWWMISVYTLGRFSAAVGYFTRLLSTVSSGTFTKSMTKLQLVERPKSWSWSTRPLRCAPPPPPSIPQPPSEGGAYQIQPPWDLFPDLIFPSYSIDSIDSLIALTAESTVSKGHAGVAVIISENTQLMSRTCWSHYGYDWQAHEVW